MTIETISRESKNPEGVIEIKTTNNTSFPVMVN